MRPMGTNQMMEMMMDMKKAHQCILVGYPKHTPRDIPIMMMNIAAYHHWGTSLYFRIILEEHGVSTASHKHNPTSKGDP